MKNKLIRIAIIVVLVVAVVFGLGVLAESCNVSLYSASLEVRDNSAINAAKVEVVKSVVWEAYSEDKMTPDAKADFESCIRELINNDLVEGVNLEATNVRYLQWFEPGRPAADRNRVVEDVLFGSRTDNGYKMLFPDMARLESIVSKFATITWDKAEVHSRNSLTVAKYAIEVKYTVQFVGETPVNYHNVIYIKLLGNVSYFDEKVETYTIDYFNANRGDPFNNKMSGWDIDVDFNRYPVTLGNRDAYAKQLVEYNLAKVLISEGYESGDIKLNSLVQVAISILGADEYNTPAQVEERLAKLRLYSEVVAYQAYLDNLELNPPEEGEDPEEYIGVVPSESEMTYWQSAVGLEEIETISLDAIYGPDNGNGWKLTDAGYSVVRSALSGYASLDKIRTSNMDIYARNSADINNYAIKVTYKIKYDTDTEKTEVAKVIVMNLEDNLLRAGGVSVWEVDEFDTYKGTTFDGTGTDEYAPIRAFDKPATYEFPESND